MRIELKKRCARKSFQQAEEMAAQATRNLDNARKRLEQAKRLEHEKSFESETISQSCQSPENIIDEEKITETQENKVESQNSNNNALKVARGICLFTLLPTVVFTLLSSSESIGDLRPHGVIASNMVVFGIIAPLLLFTQNSKMQKFAISYLTSKLKFTVFKRSCQVEPQN